MSGVRREAMEQRVALVSVGIALCSMRTWVFDLNAIIFVIVMAAYYGALLQRQAGRVQIRQAITTVPTVAAVLCPKMVGNLFSAAGWQKPPELETGAVVLLVELTALLVAYWCCRHVLRTRVRTDRWASWYGKGSRT